MNERRPLNEWLKILIWAAVICALMFALFQCEAARTDAQAASIDPASQLVDYDWSGPYYRMSAEQQAQWRNGWACYVNIRDGRDFPCNWDSSWYDMVTYHAERMQNYLELWAVDGGFPWPPEDAGLIITLAGLEWGKDPRLAAAAGICENFQCYGYTGHDPYGMRWNGPNFGEATRAFFRNLATNPAYAGCGSDPSLIDRVYNPWLDRGQYWANFEAVFWGCG